MKRTSVLFITIAVLTAGVWMTIHGGESKPADAPATGAKPAEPAAESDEPAPPKVTRDTNGNVVILISDDTQGDMGIAVTNPASVRLPPEIKGHGHALDPSPLAALLAELAVNQAAAAASSNELVRVKTLEGQGNASLRVRETAEAAALRDQLAVQSARERRALIWGKALAARADLVSLVAALSAQDSVVVRLDLPVGEAPSGPPTGARIITLAGAEDDRAEFLGNAPAVDAQMPGRGYLFLLKTNALHLAFGEPVMGYLKLPGEPVPGVIIPRDAVVRAENAGWVYVLGSDSENFTRTRMALDHPVEAGWFVTNGVSASQYVVVTGAQQLLSIEFKAQGGEGGE